MSGDGFGFNAGAGLDEVEGLAGAGHADVCDAEVAEVALLVVVFAEGGELGVGLHAVVFEGFEDPVNATVGLTAGCDAAFGGSGGAGGVEDDGLVFESFGFVNGFDDDLSAGGFVGAAFAEEFVEAVEAAFVFEFIVAGVFAKLFEALVVAGVVGGQEGAEGFGGPFGGGGVAVQMATVAVFGGGCSEGGGVGTVVEPLEVGFREGVARVGGEAEELEEGGASGVVAGGTDGGAGLYGESGDLGAEVIGEGGGVFVLADEAADADFVFAGVEGLEDVAGAFPFGLVFGSAGLKATGIAGEVGVVGGGGVVFPGLTPAVGNGGGEAGGDGGEVIEGGVDGFDDGGGGTPGGGEALGLDGGVVVGGDFVEEAVVAAAPEVEALFGVADVEEGAFAGGVLYDFVDEVLHDGPLGAAGVLEFVEEPMVEAGVEAELEEEAGGGVGVGEEGAALGGAEEAGEVVEAEATGAADALVVVAVVGLEDAVNAAGVLEGALEVVGEDGLEAGEEGAVEVEADLEGFGAAGFNEAGAVL